MDVVDKLTGKVEGWFYQFIAMLPNLLVAALIVLGFALLSRLLKKVVLNLLGRVSAHTAINNLIANVVKIAVIIAGVFFALGVLQLEKTVTSLLAGAGILGLALSFAFQDIATNFMAGVLIAVRKPYKEGDVISSNDYFGRVYRIDLRATLIRTFQGEIVYIPNKEVYQNPLTNHTYEGVRRIDLAVGVSYGDDLEKVKRITLEAVNSLEVIKKDLGVSLFYNAFGDSSINFTIRFWVDYVTFSNHAANYLQAQSDAIMAIKKAYDENDITIPFPIRTLDFGIKGGETFYEQMSAVNKDG